MRTLRKIILGKLPATAIISICLLLNALPEEPADTSGTSPLRHGTAPGQNQGDTRPVAAYPRISIRGKVIIAVGATAAIGGLITFLLTRDDTEPERDIPDPPYPPDY